MPQTEGRTGEWRERKGEGERETCLPHAFGQLAVVVDQLGRIARTVRREQQTLSPQPGGAAGEESSVGGEGPRSEGQGYEGEGEQGEVLRGEGGEDAGEENE
ncbi:MAG: hypothetical protein SGPRY_001717 [Prymnesium sp.]